MYVAKVSNCNWWPRKLINAIYPSLFDHLKMRRGIRYFTSNITAMKKISLLLPLAFVLLLSSCSMLDNFGIEKRRYNKGFYVHKNEARNTGPAAQHETTVATPEQAVAATPAPEHPQAAPAVTNPAPTAQASAAPQPGAPKKVNDAQQYVPDSKTPDKLTSAPAENVAAQPESSGPAPAGDTELVIMVILAIILSPLAVFLKEGATTNFWIDLICWLLGVGVVGFFFYGGALLLFAIVFALLIVLDVI